MLADLQKLLYETAIPVAIEAGNAALSIRDTHLKIEYKTDNSPVSNADIEANAIILSRLASTGIPIISEESEIDVYDERKNFGLYWLVDPIDGTREFVSGGCDFTVNIALIHDASPILGVIYAPAHHTIYFGFENRHAYRASIDERQQLVRARRLPCEKTGTITVVKSKSHKNAETEKLIELITTHFSNTQVISRSSSLKFCLLAEGSADLYLRCRAVNEWDIAAGHAILAAAGGKLINIGNHKSISYNSETMKTPDFAGALNAGLLIQVLSLIKQ